MLLILLGCTPASTVETSCTEDAGYEDPSPAAVRALDRANCARQVVGLPPGSLDPRVDQAAQAHADYIAATDEYGHVQSDPSHPLFTGADAAERALAHGVELDPLADALMEVVSYHSDGADPAVSVDDWIDSVYHRAPLAVPRLSGVGIGSVEVFDVMELLAPWQAGDAVDLARYPGDGQRGVPTSFDSDRESPDPAPALGVVGYPVTLSFLLAEAGSGANPYDIDVDLGATALDGPDGPVPLDVLQPATDGVLLRTVALLPRQPLQPGTTYTATVAASLRTGAVEESWSFTTSR